MDNLQFKKADFCDTNILKKLFKEAFNDEDNYIDMFFNNVYDIGDIYISLINGEVTSMMTLIDVSFTKNNITYNGAYIYAVATFKKYRKKSHMAKLMGYVESVYKNLKYDFLTLVPQTELLFSLYEKVGFKNFTYLKHMEVEVVNDFLNNSDFKEISINTYFEERENFLNNSDVISFNSSAKNYLINEITFTKNKALYSSELNCALLYYTLNENIYVREILPLNIDNELIDKIMTLFKNNKKIYFKFNENNNTGIKKPYTMVKLLNDINDEKIYSNLMLD